LIMNGWKTDGSCGRFPIAISKVPPVFMKHQSVLGMINSLQNTLSICDLQFLIDKFIGKSTCLIIISGNSLIKISERSLEKWSCFVFTTFFCFLNQQVFPRNGQMIEFSWFLFTVQIC
jgi:hypothetical protein